MTDKSSLDIRKDLFQILERISRLEWERTSHQDLKPSEGRLLGKLYFSGKETIKASDLSGQLEITPAAVTHLVNPLEEAGYLERLPDPNDRRVVLIGLTDKGKEFAQVLISDANQRLAGLIEHLGEEDSIRFIHLMSKTLDYFTTHPPA